MSPVTFYYQIRDSSAISSPLILNPRDNIKLYLVTDNKYTIPLLFSLQLDINARWTSKLNAVRIESLS